MEFHICSSLRFGVLSSDVHEKRHEHAKLLDARSNHTFDSRGHPQSDALGTKTRKEESKTAAVAVIGVACLLLCATGLVLRWEGVQVNRQFVALNHSSPGGHYAKWVRWDLIKSIVVPNNSICFDRSLGMDISVPIVWDTESRNYRVIGLALFSFFNRSLVGLPFRYPDRFFTWHTLPSNSIFRFHLSNAALPDVVEGNVECVSRKSNFGSYYASISGSKSLLRNIDRVLRGKHEKNIYHQKSESAYRPYDFDRLFPFWGVVCAPIGIVALSYGWWHIREDRRIHLIAWIGGCLIWMYGLASVLTWPKQ